ncbi:hypothetical protein KW803_01525, partial [Candidatus Saccharibacteria bacterium]|nr:hypothetical protein [Candidatus Saccharibacteria bacterium]
MELGELNPNHAPIQAGDFVQPADDLPPLTEPQQDEYYYDMSAGKLLLGETVLSAHLEETGAALDNIYSLRDLLRNDENEVPEFVYQRRPKRTKQQLLKYGRWLTEVVGEPDRPKERMLNGNIIKRANRLGIGPSIFP